jgi:hypothetical protein
MADDVLGAHSRIDSVLNSYARSWSLRAHHAEQKALQAKEARERDRKRWVNPPNHIKDAMEREHNKIIAGHEEEARRFRTRAEYASNAMLLDGPDELRDVAYRREHDQLIKLAEHAGRVYRGAQTAAVVAGLGVHAEDLEEAAEHIDSSHSWPDRPVTPILHND